MTVIALITKSSMNGLAIIGSMLFIGAGITGLFAWIFTLFLPIYNLTLYYILTFAVFVAVMLITMWDVKRITTICENGEMNNNLSLYCAFTIYTDFIYIFMRIALILAAFDRN
jgi:FtsH-binding integral membrane protein